MRKNNNKAQRAMKTHFIFCFYENTEKETYSNENRRTIQKKKQHLPKETVIT